MPFEAGAFELIFLAMVALIVVGPKDLPILLRKVGQWTAKMRGLAAEFRASFDEMARQSELDELRKEVEALRTGQFAADAKPNVESHLADINGHLNDPYWGASSQADPVQTTQAPSFEADETAALPPPGSATPPLPTRPRKGPSKIAAAQDRIAAANPPYEAGSSGFESDAAAPADDGKPARKPRARKPTAKAPAVNPPGGTTPTPNTPAPEAAEI